MFKFGLLETQCVLLTQTLESLSVVMSNTTIKSNRFTVIASSSLDQVTQTFFFWI